MKNNTSEKEKYLYFLDYGSLFRMKLIKEKLGDASKRMVLDVGCGDGSLSFLFGYLGSRIFSIDISKKAIQETKSIMRQAKHSSKFENSLIQSDAKKIPFREEIFDILCCFETLQFLPNDITALKEITRVVKPGGKVILSIPYDAKAVGREEIVRDQKRYSSKNIKKLLSFEHLRIESVIFWRFSTFELLERAKTRTVFAALGSLIEALSRNKERSVQNFRYHSLLRFYRTSFWKRAGLPFFLRILELNKLFQNCPCSDDVILLFRKRKSSEKNRDN